VEKVTVVRKVEGFQTKSGNTRFVLRDEDGDEYTTFKEAIARKALAAEGRRARIEYHEAQRGEYTNVYLDDVEALDSAEEPAPSDVDEVAWQAAIEAAPWLVGEAPAKRAVKADELFGKLKPFKDLVAEDIAEDDEEA